MASPCFRRTGQSRVHGPGAAFDLLAKCRCQLLPPRPLAVRASPQPDPLGHLLSHTDDDPPPGDVDVVGKCWLPSGGWTSLHRHASHGSALARRVASRDLLPQILEDRAASPALPRRRARSAAPEVPSIAGPITRFGDLVPPSTACPQSVEWVGRRLFDLRPDPVPVTKAR